MFYLGRIIQTQYRVILFRLERVKFIIILRQRALPAHFDDLNRYFAQDMGLKIGLDGCSSADYDVAPILRRRSIALRLYSCYGEPDRRRLSFSSLPLPCPLLSLRDRPSSASPFLAAASDGRERPEREQAHR